MKANTSIGLVDVFGVVAAAVLLGTAFWSGLIHAPKSAGRVEDLTHSLADAQRSLRQTELALQRQQADVVALEQDIAARGSLPTRSPIETDLRTVAELARDNRLELVRVTPLASKQYPGIAEIKYAVEARGDFGGLSGFLRAFESSAFWADITDLQIGEGQMRGTDPQESGRTARFIVSLFASVEGEPS